MKIKIPFSYGAGMYPFNDEFGHPGYFGYPPLHAPTYSEDITTGISYYHFALSFPIGGPRDILFPITSTIF
ncbi:unnamed protein product [Brugia pahangi]|uniref:Uncharacterized protein n=1 Tax=Brugia pahangi TaxID=6280 RepID=A0A0N4T0V4_BRUPA|nr:unnamed protein product [Brugia pahangi]